MQHLLKPTLALATLALLATPTSTAQADFARGAITLAVDATEAPKKLLHARMTFPVTPGPLALSYPKWIPGEHAPSGPLTDVAGLKITAAGKPLAWERDLVDMHTIRVTVPPGARTVEVAFDFLSATKAEGFSSAASCTENLMLLSWNQVVLYPTGEASEGLTYSASLQLPPGWKYGTALPVAGESGATIRFAPAPLNTLVDSPVIAGINFRRVDLAPGGKPRVYLDMACDSREGLAISEDQIARHRRLVAEAHALFGAHHFREYHFLHSLSDHVAHFGLEHHESSDNRSKERVWLDDNKRLAASNLLAHELVHSWNGKYRRPAGLATSNFQEPMKDDLLWVYEGLTQYLGFVLGARAGIRTPEQARANLAMVTAVLDHRPGRTWRPLQDTAVEAQLLFDAADEWESWRRGTDFYNEGLLLWLEADVTIRKLTRGARSMDDFCKSFHGGVSGAPKVVPYTFEDVVNTLNQVAPHDWAAFLKQKLQSLSPRAPMGGIEGGGWKVVYADTISPFMKALRDANETLDLRFSIGVVVNNGSGNKGGIRDVVPGSAADKAGVAPGMKLVAVNGRHWSKDVLLDAVAATKGGGALELLMDNGEFFRACKLDYRGGHRYPQLARTSGPDLLGEIIKPHAAPVRAGAEN